MSDVKRYVFDGTGIVETMDLVGLVKSSVYYAAQAELSALREELARKDVVIEDMLESNSEMTTCLTAAEQRNETLAELLDKVLNEVPHGWGESFTDSELAERIRQAIKPTESGASE
jgi:hypothetical protein